MPPSTPGLMHIGTVAERTGMSIRTLRHYDEVGLVPPSARSEGGFRLYTEQDLERITTIRRMKPLGFILDEMRQLLEAVEVLDDPEADAAAREAARQAVAECHQQAQQAYDKLRRHLGYAEEFIQLLAALPQRSS